MSSSNVHLSLIVCAAVGCWLSVPGNDLVVLGQTISGTPHQKLTDRYGDSLPQGAIARMGTTRLRHPSGTGCLAFSPNGEALASAGGDEWIRLWDVRTGREIHQFPLKAPSCVAFSPNGKTLAAGGWGDIVLWDLHSKKEIRRFSGHQHLLYALTFARGGHFLASGSRDQTARVWEVASGKEVWKSPNHHQLGVQSVAFSPDGKTLATGGDDGTVRLWEFAAGKEVRQFQKQSGLSQSLVFSADGKTLVSGGCGIGGGPGPGEVNVWEVASGKNLSKYKQEGHWFTAVLSPDGKVVALAETGSEGVALRATATGKKIAQVSSSGFLAFVIAFSADGKLLATTGVGQAIQIWDLTTTKPINPMGGHQRGITAVTFAGQGKFLATASTEGAILWESQTGKQLGPLEGNLRYDPVLAASVDGKLLAVGSGEVFLWEVEKRHLLRRLPVNLLSRPALAFSADSRSVIAPGSWESLAVWEADSGKKTAKWNAKGGLLEHVLIYDIGLTSNGKSVVAAGIDSRNSQVVCSRWEMASHKEPTLFRGQPAVSAYRLAFSPDGQLLAHDDSNDVIHIFQVVTGKELLKFTTRKGHSDFRFLWCLTFSPDGKTLATGNSDLSIRLWEVATGKERHRFLGHRDTIRGLAFSPDGKRLASVSDDTTALVWDVPGVARDKANLKKLPNLWQDLADQDAATAYRAIWALALAPGQSLPLLRQQLPPVVGADPQLTARLITELDSKQFEVRRKAGQQLAELGERAGSDLRKALAGKPSLESRTRLEKLLEKLEGISPSGELLRQLRALEVLEFIGTAEAQVVLQTLAKGTSEARLTKEARAALERLSRRSKTLP